MNTRCMTKPGACRPCFARDDHSAGCALPLQLSDRSADNVMIGRIERLSEITKAVAERKMWHAARMLQIQDCVKNCPCASVAVAVRQ